MARITLRILDGADRGRIFENISTPLTIGREEGNPIQLNDERISRFHLKIQEDEGKLVLTDLESTNGTKVNGEPVQLWRLRPGDVINLGRTVVLFGSREEIAGRLAKLRKADLAAGIALTPGESDEQAAAVSLDFELSFGHDPTVQSLLHTLVPPELPADLSPGQAAQLAELLQYVQLRLRALVETGKKSRGERISLEQRQWQNLLDLYDRMAGYLRAVGEPEE